MIKRLAKICGGLFLASAAIGGAFTIGTSIVQSGPPNFWRVTFLFATAFSAIFLTALGVGLAVNCED